MKNTTIEQAIAAITDWNGKNVKYEPVAGGITNPNFKVNVDSKDYFLKIPGAGTEFIDRNNCHIANKIASDSGAGPEVYYYFEDTGVEVFQWLDGYRQVTFGDVYKEDIFKKIFLNLKAFNSISDSEMPLHISLIDQAWDMNRLTKDSGYIPPWNDRMEYLLKRIEEAVNYRSFQPAPCHNDFWSNNIMYNEASGDLKIIDYEYASMNDPCADLGTISTINYFTEAMDVEMIKAYNDGEFDEVLFAKMKLYKIVSDIKWGYWALQQEKNSNVDYDYMNWYGIKLARLQHLWQDSRLDYWMNFLMEKPIFREF